MLRNVLDRYNSFILTASFVCVVIKERRETEKRILDLETSDGKVGQLIIDYSTK